MYIASFITNDFARKSRSLEELDRFKATELRMISMYIGPVVLRNILPKKLYEHFLLLHVALRMLSNEKFCIDNECIDYSKDLLSHFVQNSGRMYGKHFLSFNVHSLIHLPYDVRKLGSLDSFSCFRFENHLGFIKNLVRKSSKPLETILNRLRERDTLSITNKNRNPTSSEFCLLREHLLGPVIPHLSSSTQFRKLNYGPWCFTIKEPNNCAFINVHNEMQPVLINNLIQCQNGNVLIIGRKYSRTSDLFVTPTNSRNIGTHRVEDSDLTDVCSWPMTSIVCKALKLPLIALQQKCFVLLQY